MGKNTTFASRLRTAATGLAAGLLVPVLALAATSIGTDITTTGKIGIGTSNPGAALEVVASSTFDTHLRLTNVSAGTAGPGLHFDAVNRDWVIYASNAGASVGDQKFVIRDYTSAADRFIIDASGNTLVGTSTAIAKLTVEGAVAGTVTMAVRGAPSQTADLQQWLKSDGTVVAKLNNNGDLLMNGNGGTVIINTVSTTAVDLFNTVPTTVNFAGAATALNIGATSGTTLIKNFLSVNRGILTLTPNATTVSLTVKAFTNQSANMQEWQDSSAANMATMSATGTLLLNGSLRVGAAGTQITRHLSAQAAMTAPSNVAAASCSDYGTMTIVGAAFGDAITATPTPTTNGIETVSLSWNAFVSAANTVKIRVCNATATAVTSLANQTWRIDIWQH